MPLINGIKFIQKSGLNWDIEPIDRIEINYPEWLGFCFNQAWKIAKNKGK